MKLPQLVQEIIDYYRWKAKIVRCNEELDRKFYKRLGGGVYTRIGLTEYNTRGLDMGYSYGYNTHIVYRYSDDYNFYLGNCSKSVGVLPQRYQYSNTIEQLKSLFLFHDY